MSKVVLHLGSNIHERINYINTAIEGIKSNIGEVLQTSEFYETEAWGLIDQNDFINVALVVLTNLSPIDLLDAIKSLEINIGRKKMVKWGPRCIDIDIIFYENEIVDSPRLKLPHPQMENRNFVLIPLMEIVGDFVHPFLNKTIEELYIDSSDVGEVWVFENKN